MIFTGNAESSEQILFQTGNKIPHTPLETFKPKTRDSHLVGNTYCVHSTGYFYIRDSDEISGGLRRSTLYTDRYVYSRDIGIAVG